MSVDELKDLIDRHLTSQAQDIASRVLKDISKKVWVLTAIAAMTLGVCLFAWDALTRTPWDNERSMVLQWIEGKADRVDMEANRARLNKLENGVEKLQNGQVITHEMIRKLMDER